MISSEIHSHGSESCHSLQPEGGIRDANKDKCNNMWWEMRIPPWIWPPVSLSSEMPSGRAEQAHDCSSHVGVGGNGRRKIERENQLPLWMNWQATTFVQHLVLGVFGAGDRYEQRQSTVSLQLSLWSVPAVWPCGCCSEGFTLRDGSPFKDHSRADIHANIGHCCHWNAFFYSFFFLP